MSPNHPARVTGRSALGALCAAVLATSDPGGTWCSGVSSSKREEERRAVKKNKRCWVERFSSSIQTRLDCPSLGRTSPAWPLASKGRVWVVHLQLQSAPVGKRAADVTPQCAHQLPIPNLQKDLGERVMPGGRFFGEKTRLICKQIFKKEVRRGN